MVADDDDDEDEEEELVDPMEALREQCSKDAHSLALLDELAKCTERVESRTMTEETCTQVKKLLVIVIQVQAKAIFLLIPNFRNFSISLATVTIALLIIYSTI